MLYEEIPPALAELNASNELSVLENVLNRILLEASCSGFSHFCPIEGMKRSGRVLFTREHSRGARFFNPVDGGVIAKELMKLSAEARYHLPRPHPNAEKGWEIHRAMIDGQVVALVFAQWV